MYSYVGDVIALLVIWIIQVSDYSRLLSPNSAGRLFTRALLCNAGMIIVDIVALALNADALQYPLWVLYATNLAYYVLGIMTIHCYIRYVLEKLAQFAPDRSSLRPFILILRGVTLLALSVCVAQVPAHVMFYFTISGMFMHGPLWFTAYAQMCIELGLLVVAMILNNNRATRSLRRIAVTAIPVVVLVVCLRFFIPDIMFDGLATALAALLLYIQFQTSSIETDAKTGLLNVEAMAEMLDAKGKHREKIQIVLLSLRDFADLNGSFGYDFGNKILSTISEWLLKFASDNEAVFRFGPMSFAIVRDYQNIDESRGFVTKVLNTFPRTWNIDNRRIYLRMYLTDMTVVGEYSSQSVMEDLDFARKMVKHSTRGHMHFDQQVRGMIERRKYLLNYLETAMKDSKLDVWYQPIFCMGTNQFCSAEALVRLRDRDGSFIPPDEFLPVATDGGMIQQLTEFVIDRVCGFLAENKDLDIDNISINLSMQQFMQGDFPTWLAAKCAEHGISQRKLGLEVTERMIDSQEPAEIEVLERLRQGDYLFLLDDFGTGYSNLQKALHQPFDKVKIDKSLLGNNLEESKLLIDMLITLFQNNNALVVVEGVEQQEQVDYLRECGADFLQGYYFSKPLPAYDYVTFLKAHRAGQQVSFEVKSQQGSEPPVEARIISLPKTQTC